ncbi:MULTISPECIES: restriction endonuclease subunit S [unclassified Pseudoalteromonas]|uniref:restriction endonuclease subunit S n=1 Tax=unclassified Pseudoalteromonas TaxID=194690 RepID=UPI002175F01B|nr:MULTISPECIES: restriction endonuclease subunit S [unclassified Pseudoalteromonas]
MEWKAESLSNLCVMYQPKTISKKMMMEDGAYLVYGANGVIGRYNQYNHDTPQLLITCRGATCGSVNTTTGKVWINGNAMIVAPKDERLNLRYLEYLFLGGIDVSSVISGAAQPQITREGLSPLIVHYPPIPEQKRIVAILDQVFADIEQARAKTEQNLKNARELFESYLQQVFSQRGKKVKSVELGDVVDVLTDYHANGSYKVLKQHVELKEQEDFAWMVRSTDFEKKFKNEKRYITEHAYNYLTKSKLFGGEIIMSKIGNAGKVYFMPETDRPCSLAMNLFLIRLDPSKANNEYIYRYLNSSSGKAQIAPRLKGAATQTITKDNVRSLQIPMPSLDGQHEVIKNLKILEKEIESLESLYMKKLTNIEELKKSILQKAFSGKLTKTLEVDTNKGAVA